MFDKSESVQRVLSECRTRGRRLRRATESTVVWTQAERDRADLLTIIDDLEDEIDALTMDLKHVRLNAASWKDTAIKLGAPRWRPGDPNDGSVIDTELPRIESHPLFDDLGDAPRPDRNGN